MRKHAGSWLRLSSDHLNQNARQATFGWPFFLGYLNGTYALQTTLGIAGLRDEFLVRTGIRRNDYVDNQCDRGAIWVDDRDPNRLC